MISLDLRDALALASGMQGPTSIYDRKTHQKLKETKNKVSKLIDLNGI